MTDRELLIKAFIFFQQFRTHIELLAPHMRHIEEFQQISQELHRIDYCLRTLLDKETEPPPRLWHSAPKGGES